MSKKEEMFTKLIENVSPHIRLSYVIDDAGELLANFNFHPQMNEDIFITLDKCTGGNREVMLTTSDVREFSKKLMEFADLVDYMVEEYENT
jgi:hypothetical protein